FLLSRPLSSPGVVEEDASGQVYLSGHRVTLFDLVTRYNEGQSPEMLVGVFPTLSLAHVHKVIAFYLENAEQVDRYVIREAEAADRYRAAAPAGVSLD